MDVMDEVSRLNKSAITCVETHTVGMPCRIIIKGYPSVCGSLASQRDQASEKYDYIRKRVILEPRGHSDMFGAILRPDTEFTESGEAHMGLLYIHSRGYSKMCGHATLAVSRFLVDAHDPDVFPKRHLVKFDPVKQESKLVLHTLGGLVEATVPTTPDGRRSDPSRPVSFVALPAYAMATDLEVSIPPECRWPELGSRASVSVSIAYCSAFSCQTQLGDLGFPADALHGSVGFEKLRHAVAQLKMALGGSEYQRFLKCPTTGAVGSIFGVMIGVKGLGNQAEGSKGVETGLYIFADGVIDRSPTGSVAAARNAIAFAKGDLDIGESWTYHCLVSNAYGKKQGFDAKVLRSEGRKELTRGGFAAGPVVVEVQGNAYYTGYHTFVVEEDDPLGDGGFSLELLSSR
ncbi:unnamed protein product [Clonostachys rosea]|uniref:trans-L-3-hydroxyproline dehydratase n=1 Tax=Bionectria ochroleuca TaxID=29856 RepID=A0ABY6UL72_BIOOC|nr:unnamed protein product [Clonostachys rosea]